MDGRWPGGVPNPFLRLSSVQCSLRGCGFEGEFLQGCLMAGTLLWLGAAGSGSELPHLGAAFRRAPPDIDSGKVLDASSAPGYSGSKSAMPSVTAALFVHLPKSQPAASCVTADPQGPTLPVQPQSR